MKNIFKICFLLLLFLLSLLINVHAGTDHAAADLSGMFDSHGAVMLIIEPETGAVVYANKAAVSFYGYPQDILLTMNISQINTLNAEETEQEMQAAAAEKRNYFIFRHRLADGETRTVEVYSYPVQYEGRDVLFSVVHDVTDKIMLEQKEKIVSDGVVQAGRIASAVLLFLLLLLAINHRKLKASNKQIEKLNALRQTFIDADENVVYLKDENLKYVFVNKAFERFYGKKAEDVIGLDDFSMEDPEFAEIKRRSDLAVLEKGALVTDEIAYKGTVYKAMKFPVRMPDGKNGIGAGIEDITEESERRINSEKAVYRQKILLDVVTSSFGSRQEQLDYVLGQALKLTGSKIGFIYLYSEELKKLTLHSWSDGVMCGSGEDGKRVFEADGTNVWSEVIMQRGPVVVNNPGESELFKKGYPENHADLVNFMSVPVVTDGKIVAVLGLADKTGDFDDNDVFETTILMNGVWNAVERREKQDIILLERNKYHQTLVSIGDGVLVADINGNVEMLNHIAENLTGHALEEAYGKNYREIFKITREDGNAAAGPIELVFDPDSSHQTESSALLHARDGSTYSLEFNAAPIIDDAGVTVGVILVFRDITDKKEQRKQIEYLSFHDSLTGLYNRRMFENELRRLDKAENLPISIIMGDVNGLKLTNDIFGHAYGDLLLERVAGVLRACCRPDVTVARWGGDEFVLLLPRTGPDEADKITKKIKADLAKEKIKAVRGSISVGSDTKIEKNQNILYTLGKAEEKMYIAKSLEKDTFKNDILDSLIKMLHENNPREEAHSLRVSELCENMGIILGFDDKRTARLKKAGYMHDIGKVILEPDLLKSGPKLTENEEFRKHPITGFRILNAFEQTADISEAVLAHHENWDGTGFPKGLREVEIPMLSRIIAIAESYERRYADAGGDDEIRRIAGGAAVRENAGIRFDPALTGVFIGMIEDERRE